MISPAVFVSIHPTKTRAGDPGHPAFRGYEIPLVLASEAQVVPATLTFYQRQLSRIRSPIRRVVPSVRITRLGPNKKRPPRGATFRCRTD